MNYKEYRKTVRTIMIRLIIAALAVMVWCPIVHADTGGISWKTSKHNKHYTTKFYNGGHYAGKVKTSKRLPVKVITEKKCTARKVTRRAGKYILVEKITGKAINNKGDGKTSQGHYIHYRNARKGDKFTTYCVYADNSYIDDIVIRIDIAR